MDRFVRWWSRFQRLRWKLTFSYTLTTVCVLLFMEVMLLSIGSIFILLSLPHWLLNDVQRKANALRPYVTTTSIDRNMANKILRDQASSTTRGITVQSDSNTIAVTDEGFLAVVDSSGTVIASHEHGAPAPLPGTKLQTQLPKQTAESLKKIITSWQEQPAAIMNDQGVFYLIAPIVGRDHYVHGAVMMKADHLQPPQNAVLLVFLSVILVSFVVYLLCASIIGTLFGFMTARGFIRRFSHLSLAVDQWSQGNFATVVRDASSDELGQLARQLNRMAEHLQELLQTRQKLATLEERNRLARDLHDSVKQEVFAVSMQISTAKALLAHDVTAACERLNEAERLVRQSQQELTSLIRELRPVALEGKGLLGALRDLVNDWQHQTGIPVTFEQRGEARMPFVAEEALFRIAQEALSNVVRHSHARAVHLDLDSEYDEIRLAIADDGCGFDHLRPHGRGIGLLSMQERLVELDGMLEIVSARNRGTTIVAQYRQPRSVVRAEKEQ
jgi:signal transduction histidine kinase